MSKKSTPAEKAARMLDLVPYISTHQGISFQELARDFGISESELTSDLNALWMCGDNRFDLIDLEFESGFVSIRNAETINIVRSLSSQEIVSLLIGLDLIAKQLPSDRHDLQTTVETLKQKLGKGLEHVVDASPTSTSSIFPVVHSALNNGKKLLIEYYNASEDRLTSRTITPLEISRSREKEFLIAFCELTQSQRTFRIDRIRSAEIVEEPATHPISAHIATETISAHISVRSNFRKTHETLGTARSDSPSVVSIETFSPSWLLRTLIASGGAMVLHEPISVRQEILRSAKAALALYD